MCVSMCVGGGGLCVRVCACEHLLIKGVLGDCMSHFLAMYYHLDCDIIKDRLIHIHTCTKQHMQRPNGEGLDLHPSTGSFIPSSPTAVTVSIHL